MDYALLFIAYFCGSIPFGLLIAKATGHGDIRKIGSGNIGATNVLRTGKKSLAVLTLLLDMLKGTAPVLLTNHFSPDFAGAAALLALLGHMFPVWLKFKGGKGVATGLGVMIGLAYPVAIMAMLVWLASAFLLRISSASAILAVCTMPVFVEIYEYSDLHFYVMAMIFLILFKHRSNIGRLLNGTEPHIGEKNKNEKNQKA